MEICELSIQVETSRNPDFGLPDLALYDFKYSGMVFFADVMFLGWLSWPSCIAISVQWNETSGQRCPLRLWYRQVLRRTKFSARGVLVRGGLLQFY